MRRCLKGNWEFSADTKHRLKHLTFKCDIDFEQTLCLLHTDQYLFMSFKKYG